MKKEIVCMSVWMCVCVREGEVQRTKKIREEEQKERKESLLALGQDVGNRNRDVPV